MPLRSPRRAEFSDGEPDTHRGDTHPGGTAIQRLTRDTTSFYFDAAATPALTIASGDTVMVETQHAHGRTITGPDVVYTTRAQVMEQIGGANPVTGPIAIDGVVPGDLLAVEVLDVARCARDGLRLHEHDADARSVVRSRDDDLSSPGRHGGVSPRIAGRCAFRTGRSSGPSAWRRPARRWRRSCNATTCSATSTCRSCVPGAPWCCGRMSPAECCRSAMHTSLKAMPRSTARRSRRKPMSPFGSPSSVPVQARIRACRRSTAPRGSAAWPPVPGHLEDLVRAAYDDLASRIREDHGFTLPEAYRLLGAVGTVRIGQVVPPVYSAMAMIERRFVAVG